MIVGNGKKGLVVQAANAKIPFWIRSTIPSGANLVIEAFPVQAIESWIERFTLSSATTLTLSNIPASSIEQLFVNDVLLTEGTDYTLDQLTGTVTFTIAQTGNAKVYYKALPTIDTEAFASITIAGDGTEKRKTSVFDLSGIPYVAFVLSSDSVTEFEVYFK